MASRTLTERTIYEARCECGSTDVRTENPPRETRCIVCGKWNTFKPINYIGPDKFGV